MRQGWILGGVLLLALPVFLYYLLAERPTPQSKHPSQAPGFVEAEVREDAPLAPIKELVLPEAPTRELEEVGEEGPKRELPEVGQAALAEETPELLLFDHGLFDPMFPGGTWRLGLGFANAGAGFPPDSISSVQVPSAWQVTLFEDEDGHGKRIILGPGRHNLSSYGFSDRTSSLRVTRVGQSIDAPNGPADAVLLYEHSTAYDSKLGVAWTLRLPRRRNSRLFTSHEGHFEAGVVSAAWVPPGYSLTLFEKPDGFGPALVLGPGFHELDPMGFNDRATSARVRRDP